MNDSMIYDINLADEGLQRIQWVEKFMPALNTLRKDLSCIIPESCRSKCYCHGK